MLQPANSFNPKEAANIFTTIWQDVSAITDVVKYINVADVYAEFPVKHINVLS